MPIKFVNDSFAFQAAACLVGEGYEVSIRRDDAGYIIVTIVDQIYVTPANAEPAEFDADPILGL